MFSSYSNFIMHRYDAVGGKSKCLIADEAGVICNTDLQGKYVTNLKVHLRSMHKKMYEICCKNDENLKLSKKVTVLASSRPAAGIAATATADISKMFAKGASWSSASMENTKREKALTTMFITTGLPVRLVEEEGFKAFCSSLEPKFNIPGMKKNELIIYIKSMYE